MASSSSIQSLSAKAMGLVALALAIAAFPALSHAEPAPAEAAPALPFAPGEQFGYDVTVLGAKAGSGVLKVSAPKTWKGKKVTPVAVVLKSEGFWANAYPAHDKMLSLLTSDGGIVPVHSELVGTRKDRKRNYKLDFDTAAGKVSGMRIDVKDGKTHSRKLLGKVPVGTHDMLSWLFHVRTLDLEPGDTFSFVGHSGNFLYDVDLKVTGTEDVWTPAGFVEANRIDVTVTRQNNRKLSKSGYVYIGTDARRLPVKGGFEFTLGKVEAVLSSIETPRVPQTADAAPVPTPQ
jgi:hypothetical protein